MQRTRKNGQEESRSSAECRYNFLPEAGSASGVVCVPAGELLIGGCPIRGIVLLRNQGSAFPTRVTSSPWG